MGWLIALAILVLIACIPLGVSVIYNKSGAILRLLIGPFSILLYPQKKKKEKTKKPKKQQQPKPQAKSNKPKEPEKKGGSLTDFLPLLRIAVNFLGDLRRKIRVKRMELKLSLAGDDPCDLALNYGRAWAAVGNILPQLERLFVIQKQDVDVQCDFTADSTTIYLRLDITITVGRMLGLAFLYGFRAVLAVMKIFDTKKDGASK